MHLLGMFKLKKTTDPRARLETLQNQLAPAQDAVEAARAAVVETIADGSPPETTESIAWKAELHAQGLEKAIEALAAEIADQEARERVIAALGDEGF